MRSNGLSLAAPVSPLQKQSQLVFHRMGRQLAKLIRSTTIDNVHKFRTNSRRVEALVSEFVPENGNQKKLLKLLSKMRKKAGKVRDLDVQIALLKELKVSDRQNQSAQLLDWLEAEQARRKKKLEKAFDIETAKELRKRLARVQKEVRLEGVDALKLAHKRLPSPDGMPMSEKMLHACRIEAKKARYLAELAPGSLESKIFIEELKRAQDAIGEWHDVLKLKQRAEKLFGGVHQSSVVSMLQNLSRAKFRQATTTLLAAIGAVSQSRKPMQTVPGPKTPEREIGQTAVA